MKKLNRRGYLTIEIVLASTLAFTIAFFLIDLTIKFANKTDDIQLDTLYITDNALLIENIREAIDIDKAAEVENGDVGKITSIECKKEENKCTFTFDDSIAKQSTLSINNGSKEVIYTGLKEGNTYTKKVSDNLTLEEISVGKNTTGIIQQNPPYQIITIKARDIFVDKNYDINILIKTTQ